VGGDLGKFFVKVEDKTLNLQVWDTSGMECYRSVARTFYRGSHAVVLVYSLIDRTSFEKMQDWLCDVREEAREDAVVVLVGNKKDAIEDGSAEREVSEEDVAAFSKEHRVAASFEVSAKSGDNVENVYFELAKLLFEIHKDSI